MLFHPSLEKIIGGTASLNLVNPLQSGTYRPVKKRCTRDLHVVWYTGGVVVYDKA